MNQHDIDASLRAPDATRDADLFLRFESELLAKRDDQFRQLITI